jgi:hypothetical protein
MMGQANTTTETKMSNNSNFIRNFIEQEHQSNQVVVWSKSYETIVSVMNSISGRMDLRYSKNYST